LSSLKNLESFIEAAKIGKSHDIPVILNPGMLIIDQGIDNIKVLLEEVDILILSQREFTTLMNIKDTELNIEANQIKLNELFNFGIKIIIITMGKKGAALCTQIQSEIIPAINVDEVIDTTGAGDAFSAGFIYGFAQNKSYQFEDVKNNVKCGNIIAGNCIQKLGARNGIPKLK
jgi:ribokinase